MKRTWARRLVRIGLGILVVLVTIGAGLFIWNPNATTLLVAVILQPLLDNTQPPAIVDGHFTSDDELTDVLNQKFPFGTNEAVLRATLFQQGFKPLKPPPVACWPRGKPAPVGQLIFPCPLHDPSKTLEYQWSNFPCGDTITVWWSTTDDGAITQIGSNHIHGCL
jgi:hypothetical protein